jgi:hypothetical protein
VADGEQTLARWIAQLNELGELPARSAPKIAVALKREIEANVARQVGPDGKPWPATEAGTPALKNVGSHLRVVAVGSVVIAELEGHYARHHLGAVRGKRKRQILPSGKLTEPMTRAVKSVVTGEFHAIMGGG